MTKSAFFFIYLTFFATLAALSQPPGNTAILYSTDAVITAANDQVNKPTFHPLEKIAIKDAPGKTFRVADAAGHLYASGDLHQTAAFTTGGALSEQTIDFIDPNGKTISQLHFTLNASTTIDDGGPYRDMFRFLYNSMCVYSPTGVDSVFYNGKWVHYFVQWGLDNYNTQKGMQYFSAAGAELTDVFAQQQRKDGMIWSFIAANNDGDYFKTAYSPYGFFDQQGNVYFVRQPTENHVEYIFVNTIYQCWKASGDAQWMRGKLEAARRALDYSMHDSLRWSSRYQLLKRALTIDSWDFQVDDEYTPQLGVGNPMLIDFHKTKFGIFYGDNTGYAQACRQLAEMLGAAGDNSQAKTWQTRAGDIMQRLDALSWNGHFFTHFIDEDPAVQRHLGVDIKSQLSQSNAYSLNRGLTYAQDTAIIHSYLDLYTHLPIGSPAEWYSIYPPFARGFGAHDAVWQYMNGGVGGHVAGELAHGAFDNGYETYGADILNRLYALGKKYSDKVWFAYTGSFPAPPKPVYRQLDLSPFANMRLSAKGDQPITNQSQKPPVAGFFGNTSGDGNDLAALPVGNHLFDSIPFHFTDPAIANTAGAIGLSNLKGFVQQVALPINDTAAAIYLLHDATGGTDDICAEMRIEYMDTTDYVQYIQKGRHLGGWWFPHLTQDQAGVAWSGPNAKSSKVGAYWAAITNPHPGKTIARISFRDAQNGAIYALFAVTLSSQPHYVRPKGESFGGPDNWAAATAMAALIQGLAGANDKDVAYRAPVIEPRWIAAGVDSINVTSRYAASNGYVSYSFRHNGSQRSITLQLTGNARQFEVRVLLPPASSARRVSVGKAAIKYEQYKVGSSPYVKFEIPAGAQQVAIQY